MAGSDSPTNLAWLINQNTPSERLENIDTPDAHGEARKAAALDFASMTINPELLEKTS